MVKKGVITGLNYAVMEEKFEKNGISHSSVLKVEGAIERIVFELSRDGNNADIPLSSIVRLNFTEEELYYAINYAYKNGYTIHSFVNINCSLSNFIYLGSHRRLSLPKPYSEIRQNRLIKKAGLLRLKIIKRITELKSSAELDDISDFISSSFLNLISELSSDDELDNLYSQYLDVRNDLLVHNLRAANKVASERGFLFLNSDDRSYFVHYYTLEAIEKYLKKYYSVDSKEAITFDFGPFLFSYLRFMSLRQCYDDGDLIRKSSTLNNTYFKIKRLIMDGKDERMISEILNMSLDKVRNILNIFEGTESLEEVLETEPSRLIDETLDEDPYELYVNEELRERMLECLDYLDDSSKTVMMLRYGFTNGKPMNLREIGKFLGISHESVRKIQNNSLKILQDNLHEYDYMEYVR